MDIWIARTVNPDFRDLISAVLSDSSTTIKKEDRGRAKRRLMNRLIDALLASASGRKRTLNLMVTVSEL